MTRDPIILEAFHDPVTGFYVEHHRRTNNFVPAGSQATFWTCFPEDGDPFHTTHGDTMQEAVVRMLVREPMQVSA